MEDQAGKNMEHKTEAELVKGFTGIIAKAGLRERTWNIKRKLSL